MSSANWRVLPRQPRQAFPLVAVAVDLSGCAITIEQPSENTILVFQNQQSKAKVVIAGNAPYWGPRVAVDGTDVSNQMPPTSAPMSARVGLPR